MRMQWNQLLNSERRRVTPKRSGEFRSEFERDYDRSVFSTPVRRLQDKAQVFPLEPHDAVRTRLTHSLEVSTVARDLAGQAAEWIMQQEGLSPTQAKDIPVIAATCGLIHDLGNPPFGHAGEQAISSWFHKQYPVKPHPFQQFAASFHAVGTVYREDQLANDFWKFEGNAQTLRLISRLQVMQDFYGLNLTYGTLSAVCKYIAASDKTTKEQEKKKPGYFASENKVVEDIRTATGTGEARNPITYLVEASDDIVYSVVDIEDAVKKGVVRWTQIRDELGKWGCPMVAKCLDDSDGKERDDEVKTQLFRVNGINAMVAAVLKTFKHHYEAIMRGEYHGELISDSYCKADCFVKACKKFASDHVYTSKETLRLEIMGRQVIHDLMDVFWEGASDIGGGQSVKEFPGKIHRVMSNNYRKVYREALKEGLPEIYCQRLLLTDYICGMTDTFACTLHKQLKNG